MTKKEAIYILVALTAISIVYFLATEGVDEEDCECDDG